MTSIQSENAQRYQYFVADIENSTKALPVFKGKPVQDTHQPATSTQDNVYAKRAKIACLSLATTMIGATAYCMRGQETRELSHGATQQQRYLKENYGPNEIQYDSPEEQRRAGIIIGSVVGPIVGLPTLGLIGYLCYGLSTGARDKINDRIYEREKRARQEKKDAERAAQPSIVCDEAVWRAAVAEYQTTLLKDRQEGIELPSLGSPDADSYDLEADLELASFGFSDSSLYGSEADSEDAVTEGNRPPAAAK